MDRRSGDRRSRRRALPPQSPFWDAPHTLVTSHIGAVTQAMYDRGADTFEINLERYLAGRAVTRKRSRRQGRGYYFLRALLNCTT